MTKAAIEALVNSLLAPNQPITANGQHKPSMQALINELYDAASRGAVLNGVPDVLSLMTGDKVLLFRSGVAFKADKSLFGGGGTGVTDGDKVGVQVSDSGATWIPKDFVRAIVDTTGGEIILDLQSKEYGTFSGSTTISAPRSVTILNFDRANEYVFWFDTTDDDTPIDFGPNARSTHASFVDGVFTPMDAGLWKAHATRRYGTDVWGIDFNGVYSVGDAPPDPPDPGDTWVMGSGIWNDGAVWKDTGIWKDNP